MELGKNHRFGKNYTFLGKLNHFWENFQKSRIWEIGCIFGKIQRFGDDTK